MKVYDTIDSPVGKLLLTAEDAGLTSAWFEPHHVRMLPGAVKWYRAGEAIGPASDVLAAAREQLGAYFAGTRTTFDLPLAAAGTDFQKRVWAALRAIAFGETISYGELARRIGDPAASRAVGLANGRNPIPVIVPCHRVIGAKGELTGFGGGLERKRWLLQHEGALLV